jgi:hypothetical protein
MYTIAFDQDINIINAHFSQTKKAACMHRGNHKNIILDKKAIDSKSEEGILLSEEIGHYETHALYMIRSSFNTPCERSNRMKYEGMAKNWAYEHYLPSKEIQKGINYGGADVYLVAEYCDVTVEFLHKAINYHKSKGIEFEFSEDYIC